MVHECLECWRSIAEAEKHDCGFIETEGSNECGLPLIFFTNVNIVISPSDVEFGKEGGVFHVIDQLRNEWERISIAGGVAVKVVIILAGVECSILFLNEEEWGGLWGFGGYYMSSLKMFIDESFASFLFGGVKRIDFRNLWDKGIFELNSVIKGSMRRENVIGLF